MWLLPLRTARATWSRYRSSATSGSAHPARPRTPFPGHAPDRESASESRSVPQIAADSRDVFRAASNPGRPWPGKAMAPLSGSDPISDAATPVRQAHACMCAAVARAAAHVALAAMRAITHVDGKVTLWSQLRDRSREQGRRLGFRLLLPTQERPGSRSRVAGCLHLVVRSRPVVDLGRALASG
jgi:hypothetical protein